MGHSLGGLAVMSYIDQFGCGRLKRIVNVDISPCSRNFDGWTGGLARGEWTDEDFMQDMDRYFSDTGLANWVITKKIMNPALDGMPPEMEFPFMVVAREGIDKYASPALWFSVWRTDLRPAISKITVPFLHVLPELPICGQMGIDFIRDNVQGPYAITDPIPGTTHMVLLEAPKPAADAIKDFLKKY